MRNRSAKNIYYGEPKSDELSNKLLGNADVNKKSIIDEFIKESDVIDLSNRNVGNFHDLLQSSINKSSPMFLWSKERQNNKVRLDNEYQLLILEKIRNLRLISDEYNRLQADQIFTREFIRNLIANKRMEAEHFFEDAVASHRVNLTKMKVDIDLTNSLVDHDQIEKDRKIAENERIKIQNEEAKAKVEDIKSITRMRDKVTDNFDPSTLDPKHISQIVINAILPGNGTQDFDFQNGINDSTLKAEEAKAEMLRQQAAEQKIKVDELRDKKKWNDEKRKKL